MPEEESSTPDPVHDVPDRDGEPSIQPDEAGAAAGSGSSVSSTTQSGGAPLDVGLLRTAAEDRGIELDDDTVDRFTQLAEALIERNEQLNLTRLTDPDQIAIQHVADSLMGLRAIGGNPHSQLRVIDVGSGAGFPGLAIAIARPRWEVTLLDSKRKVVDWLNDAAEAVGADNVRAVQMRAEDAGQDKAHRQRYDVALARAVAALPTLLELTLPLVKRGGITVAWKGSSVDGEIAAAANALSALGGGVGRRIPYELPGLDYRRTLVVIEKRRNTPRAYPRQAGTPKREPL